MQKYSNSAEHLGVSNGNFNFNTRFDGDWSNLLHNIRWAEKVNHSLVHTQLKPIECVCS